MEYDRRFKVTTSHGVLTSAQLIAADGAYSVVNRTFRIASPRAVYPNPSQAANLEPRLINTVGSLADRPEAFREIPNLFLAADYVRSHTDLACMEAANEAARRAVNALLERVGSPAPRAAVWPLTEPAVFNRWKEWDRLVYEKGQVHSFGRALWAGLRRWVRRERAPQGGAWRPRVGQGSQGRVVVAGGALFSPSHPTPNASIYRAQGIRPIPPM